MYQYTTQGFVGTKITESRFLGSASLYYGGKAKQKYRGSNGTGKNRVPLEKLRLVPKYKDLSAEDYEHLITDAETIALLILRAFFFKK